MTIRREAWFWLIGFVVFFGALYLFRSILLPFVAGMAVAYFLDPICDRLETMGLSRLWSVIVVSTGFVVALVALSVLIAPLVIDQVNQLIEWLPRFVASLRDKLVPLVALIQDRMDSGLADKIRDSIGNLGGRVAELLGQFLGEVLRAGFDFANLLSLLIITPIVAFYLMRDWDQLIERIDSWLPRDYAETIRGQIQLIDETLAGFVRGQASVCLILGLFYSVALSLAGLQFGLIIGIVAGLLSFIPYVGSITGFLLSVGLAFAQFATWLPIAIVAAIFVVGQAVEGNYLTPKLVGEQVGLHPVWVIFALLAGGALFGFLGILLAVPVAAVVGVLVRFFLQRYLASSYYRGAGRHDAPADPPRPVTE